ncbi:MAG: class I SAM-dependent methyltransferase [Anaerolineales bacterium]
MYDELSQTYDHFVNWENRLQFELPFLNRILSQIKVDRDRPIRILDAACSTGMHAIALAKEGYECAATDISPQMIQQAQKNASDRQVTIQCETVGLGEMTPVFGNNAFQAILCLGNSLPHLLTKNELQSAMRDFYALLSVGGVLIIQNRNFEPVLKKQLREMEPQSFQTQDREELFIRFYDFLVDGNLRFNFISLTRVFGGSWHQSWHSSILKPYLQSELESVMQTIGFGDIMYYGSLAGEPYDASSSGNLVIVAWKKGD